MGLLVADRGGNSAAGDAKRVWHVHNLLVSFDENGMVQNKKVFSEDRALWLELHTRLADAPPLDLAQPLAIKALGPGKLQTITLGKDSIEFDLPRAKTAHFEVRPQAILRISHDWVTPANPGVTCHMFYLAEKSPAGKRVSFCASPPTSQRRSSICSNTERRCCAGTRLLAFMSY